ncbi:TcaA NTF2-like domain-containing protein [Rossellomorea marisflavi]|uniref:TcaA NTF2-like domain-containing protein n=1 Tax=Rossellomorea marisflavi TaxID=189381 RepID=UPI00404434F2
MYGRWDKGHLKEEVIDFKVISIEEDGSDYLGTTQETFDIEDSDEEVTHKSFRPQL